MGCVGREAVNSMEKMVGCVVGQVIYREKMNSHKEMILGYDEGFGVFEVIVMRLKVKKELKVQEWNSVVKEGKQIAGVNKNH